MFVLHDLKDPNLRELCNTPCYGKCRICIINRGTYLGVTSTKLGVGIRSNKVSFILGSSPKPLLG